MFKDRGNMIEEDNGFIPLLMYPLMTNTDNVCKELGLSPQI